MHTGQFPTFEIQPHQVAETYRDFIAKIKKAYSDLKQLENPTYESFASIDILNDQFGRFSSELHHLISVSDMDNTLHAAYEEMIPELSAFYSELGQDVELYGIFKTILEKEDLKPEEKRILEKEILDFKHLGVELPKEQQKRLSEISQQLSLLASRFAQNTTNDSDQMNIDLVDDSRLDGVSDEDKARFAKQAEGVEGIEYRIKTNAPDFSAIALHCKDRELRKEVYMNNNTVASKGEYDNTEIMKETLRLREEKVSILGYKNYAEYSLSKKMAETPEQVIDFLEDLTSKAKGQYKEESKELKEFAVKEGIISSMDDTLEPWDAGIAGEMLQKHKFNFSMQEIKKHFMLENVQNTLFWLIDELFGYQLAEVKEPFAKYHPDLNLIRISKDDETIAYIYTDIFAREGKRSGAWMSDYTSRDGDIVPVAFVTCNFSAPTGDQPALLSLDDVTTLFHEFGHALHHTLTRIQTRGVDGISGVPWDAVELPSTFMEFFCYKDEVLSRMDSHYITGAKIEPEVMKSVLAAQHDGAAMFLMRQMELSLVDMHIHTTAGLDVYETIDKFKAENDLPPRVEGTAFFNKFGHIFAGGYAAGYYSYKWADILASDIFATFDENGVISREYGQKYLDTILSQGGSKEFMEMFRDFKGAEPDPRPFLKYAGINC